MNGDRRFEDVAVGDRLDPLVRVVTPGIVVLGSLAHRDFQPVHHDRDAAVALGFADVFLSTPTIGAWLGRYLTDWSGPSGRLGQLRSRMLVPIVPGDEMRFSGTVTSAAIDGTGCGWVAVELSIATHRPAVQASARLALPTADGEAPWARRGDRWRPTD